MKQIQTKMPLSRAMSRERYLTFVTLYLFFIIQSIVSCREQQDEEEDTNSTPFSLLLKRPSSRRISRRISYGLLFAHPSSQGSVMPNMYGMQYYPQMDPYMMQQQQQQQVIQPQQQVTLTNPWATTPLAYATLPAASNPTASYAPAASTGFTGNPISLLFGGGGGSSYPLFSHLFGR